MIRPAWLGCALVATLAACSHQDVRDVERAVASSVPASVSSGVADGAIVAQVVARFAAIDPVSAMHVRVSANDGLVRFTGTVSNTKSAFAFVRAAHGVRGVKGVTPAIRIRPLGDPAQPVRDFALASAVQANVAVQAGANALGVHVRANGSTVTLDGSVDTANLAATVLAAARKTAGVTKVVDRVRVGR